MSKADIQKQVEYYLGDANLAIDDFFRDLVGQNKDGYIDIGFILKCNKIKKLGVNSSKQIADAIADSKDVELDKEGKKIRRTANKALPAKIATSKKRDAKAEEKKASTAADPKEQEFEPVERDDMGRIKFCERDFEKQNTLIVHFKTADQDAEKDAEYKVNWKDLEVVIKEKFPQVKVVYSRADKYEGDLAISSWKYHKEQYQQLSTLKNQLVGTKHFDFAETQGEELDDFWQKQGGHYSYCIAPKQRLARKVQRKVQEAKREERNKRQKQSYTIAGVYYMDINKVKSKSRAILNLKKDGESLDKADCDFMQEIIKFHDNQEQKMKDFDHFEVGCHPTFVKTRCFFTVKKDGSKEDFSVSKCI
jgi:hypothetical protein